MVEYIPPPDPRTLLPPLLACLPAAFASPRPPPALLSLLSPILRQRVQLLSSTSSDSWLRLLCWDVAKAERIQTIVENTTFEPHPVSGEIEITEDIPVKYKRFDEETLRSRVSLPEYKLTVWYVWCGGDQEGGGPGWRVAQLLPQEEETGRNDPDSEKTWSETVADANVHARERMLEEAMRTAEQGSAPNAKEERLEDEDDDDDYWAQYDATPARTPAVKQTGGLGSLSGSSTNGRTDPDDSYFARYADVQPALDNDDPSEDQNEVGGSTLNGDVLANILRRQSESLHAEQAQDARAYANGMLTDEGSSMKVASETLNHPRPSSASSNGSGAVAKLEQSAESQSASEIGVKQHISTNIKSMYRLAKSTGMTGAEFDSLVKRELEVLCIADDEG